MATTPPKTPPRIRAVRTSDDALALPFSPATDMTVRLAAAPGADWWGDFRRLSTHSGGVGARSRWRPGSRPHRGDRGTAGAGSRGRRCLRFVDGGARGRGDGRGEAGRLRRLGPYPDPAFGAAV